VTTKEMIAILEKLPQNNELYFMDDDSGIAHSPVPQTEMGKNNATFVHVIRVGYRK
jgi:hypothetical protein